MRLYSQPTHKVCPHNNEETGGSESQRSHLRRLLRSLFDWVILGEVETDAIDTMSFIRRRGVALPLENMTKVASTV